MASGVNTDETFDLVNDAFSKTRRISVTIGFTDRVWSYAQITYMFGFVGQGLLVRILLFGKMEQCLRNKMKNKNKKMTIPVISENQDTAQNKLECLSLKSFF